MKFLVLLAAAAMLMAGCTTAQNDLCIQNDANCDECDLVTPAPDVCLSCVDTHVLVDGVCVAKDLCIQNDVNCDECDLATPAPAVCLSCVNTHVLVLGVCELCTAANCTACAAGEPTKCAVDGCLPGFSNVDGVCVEDTVCTAANCLTCQTGSTTLCQTCNATYTAVAGVCERVCTFVDWKCKACNATTNDCIRCKHYNNIVDATTGLCRPKTCLDRDANCAVCSRHQPMQCKACTNTTTMTIDHRTGLCRPKTCVELNPACARCNFAGTQCIKCRHHGFVVDAVTKQCRPRVCTDVDPNCGPCEIRRRVPQLTCKVCAIGFKKDRRGRCVPV